MRNTEDMMYRMVTQMLGVKAGDKGKRISAPLTVYRVELPNGHGPYNSGRPDAEKIYEKLCGTSPKHPGFDCARLARMDHEKCGITDYAFSQAHGEADYGCLTLEAIGDWFSLEARRYLRTLSAQLIEYEVPKGGYVSKLGHGEVLFVRDKAKRVRALDVVKLG
jgi:hypothetical protein